MIAFFSLWEIRFLTVCVKRVCRFIACMCMCCMYVCVCMCVYVCHFYCGLTSMYALHVCVLYVRPGASRSSWCVSLIVCVCVCVRACVCVCVVALAPVVRLHDSRCIYGVLLCADAWPVWERVCVCVCVCVCVSNSTVRVSDARLAFDRRCCTKHSMYLFQSWISGIIWFQSMISLVVHVCFFMQCSSALQGSSRVSQLHERGLLPLIFPPAGLLSV